MHAPQQLPARPLGEDRHVLPAYLPVPGAGILPVNAFVLEGSQSVLVDTGVRALEREFLDTLRQVIDPADLAWIWITHADADHIGNLQAVLKLARHAKVVTNFLGLAKMGLWGVELPRVQLLNPGEVLNAGDRKLVAMTPPTYDAPETTGAFDPGSRTLLSADCFGALMSEPSLEASTIGDEALREGMHRWSMVDAPWLRSIERGAFSRALDAVDELDAKLVLSAHLPPAVGMTSTLLTVLADAPEAAPFVGPNQAAFEHLMVSAAG